MKVLKKLVTNPLSLIGFLLLLGFVAVAILAPVLAPPQPNQSSYRIPRDGWSGEPQPPNSEHRFGTSQGQYDIFYGVIWGTRTAFRIGITLVVVASAIGIVVGSIAR